MELSRPVEHTPDFLRRQHDSSLALDPSRDDLLLTATEIQDAWEITGRRLRRLVQADTIRRVRRPTYQPYYPMSAVVAALGPPKHDPDVMPTYLRENEYRPLAA